MFVKSVLLIHVLLFMPVQAISFSSEGGGNITDEDKQDIAITTQNKLIPFLFIK